VIAPIILDYILHRDCSFGYRNSMKGRTTFGISRLNNDVTKAPANSVIHIKTCRQLLPQLFCKIKIGIIENIQFL
jgi:hypothetical protein